MATRNQTVRNSLLRSSISIKNIRESVTNFSTAFSSSRKSADNIVESLEEDNKFKKSFLVSDNSYFNKRQENIRRKDREDEIEASSVGGAIKKTGDITQTSTRGFLGRILDFVGILFIGWVIQRLPILNKNIQSFLSRGNGVLKSLRNYTDGIIGAFSKSNQDLEATTQKFEVESTQFKEGETEVNNEADKARSSIVNINRQVSQQFQVFKDPKNAGFKESTWEQVGNIEFEKGKSDRPGPQGGYGQESDDALKNMREKKGEDTKKEDKKEEQKTGFGINVAKSPENTTQSIGPNKSDVFEAKEKLKEKSSNNKEKDPFSMTQEEEEDSGIDSKRTNTRVTKDEKGNITKSLTYEDGTQRIIYYPKSGGFEQRTIYPDGRQTKKEFDMFADGGRPNVGETSIVGEKGPELFVPDRSGTIVPNSFFDKKPKRVNADFIERIINNKEQDRTTKLRAAFQLYEKLVRQYVEDNNGLITIDKDEEIKAATVGRLKRALNAEESKNIDGKKTDMPSEVEKFFKTDNLDENVVEAFNNLDVDTEKISGFLNNLKSITTKKIRDENITKKISSARKKPKVIVVPVSSPQSQTKQQSPPTIQSSSKKPETIITSKFKMVNSFTNKFHELELSYT